MDHFEHVAEVAGIGHVGLGPDFIKEVLADTTPPCCERAFVEGVPAGAYLPGLDGPAGLPLVTEALLRLLRGGLGRSAAGSPAGWARPAPRPTDSAASARFA